MSKIFVSNLFVEKGDTTPDTDLIYFKKLPVALTKTLTFFFDPDKKILDVTAGMRKSWSRNLYETLRIDGKPFADITFLDASADANCNIQADFRKLPFKDNSFDIVYFDPPFTEIKNAQEAHGTHDRKGRRNVGNRHFYFRGLKKWIPPEAYFFVTWREFNRVSRNGLIVKISERFKNRREIPVTTYMDLAYDNIFNKKSGFERMVQIGYRGKRMATGARSGNPQRVLSYYAVYKKDRRMR